MKNILLLDTSVGSFNIGDHVIMECVRDELAFLLNDAFVYDMPTHLPCFNAFAVFRNSSAVQTYAGCDLKFAGGSNLMVKDLLTHYPQWNISRFNSKPLALTRKAGGLFLILRCLFTNLRAPSPQVWGNSFCRYCLGETPNCARKTLEKYSGSVKPESAATFLIEVIPLSISRTA